MSLNGRDAEKARQTGRGWRGALALAWDFWKAYAEKIGHYQTAAILTIVYGLVVGPIWLVGRATGHRFLPLFSRKAPTFWHHTSMGRSSLADLKRQG